MRGLLCSLMVLMSFSASYAYDEVDVSLIKGVVHKVNYALTGRTQVTASVTNLSNKPLKCLTIITSYSALESVKVGGLGLEGDNLHKIRLNPPLPPGKSRTVKFTDANGCSYIDLDYENPEFVTPPPTVWAGDQKLPCAVIDGRLHVYARTLMNALGGTIEAGSVPGQVVMKLGESQATAEKASAKPALPVLPSVERNGQTYVPLVQLTKQLPLSMTCDDERNKYVVSLQGNQGESPI